MQIWPDPLRTKRSVGSDQQWCVTLPASYPTIFPYIPNNIESNEERTPNASALNIAGTGTVDSSLCAKSQLIQRLRYKFNLHQTSLSNNTQNLSPSPNRVVSKPRNPSLAQQDVEKKSITQRVLSADSANRSLYSTHSSTHQYQTNDVPNQFSPTPSVQSLSTGNENHSNKIASKSIKDLGSHSNGRSTQASPAMSISVPSISRTPFFSKQQLVSSVELRQSIHDLISSTSDNSEVSDDPMSSSSLSPSHSQQDVDSRLSSKQSTASVQSPVSYTSDSEEQELSTPSIHSRTESTFVKSNVGTDRIQRKQNSWLGKHPTSFHGTSPDSISHLFINNQKRYDCLDRLHLKDAMTAFEFDLAEEACQALIDKTNELKKNTFLRLLTASFRCCRSCRTQRRLASIAQRSIDIALKNSTNTYR